jgi:hypothetical protein
MSRVIIVQIRMHDSEKKKADGGLVNKIGKVRITLHYGAFA